MSNTFEEDFSLSGISEETIANLNNPSLEQIAPIEEPSVSVETELKTLENLKNKRDAITQKNPKYLSYIEGIKDNYIISLAHAELVNIPFFGELRTALYHPVKAQIMDAFNIRSSYTGFYQFYDGNRPMLPHTGLMKIAESLNYSIYQIPIRNDAPEEVINILEKYQNEFVSAVRAKIVNELPVEQKRSKPSKSSKKVKPMETNEIMVGFINNENASSVGSMISNEINDLVDVDSTSLDSDLDPTLDSISLSDAIVQNAFDPLAEVVVVDANYNNDEYEITQENEKFESDMK